MIYETLTPETLSAAYGEIKSLERRTAPLMDNLLVVLRQRYNAHLNFNVIGFEFNEVTGDLEIKFEWPHDPGTEFLTITADDLTYVNPGIAARLRILGASAATRKEAKERELAKARATVLQLEAELGV